MADLTEALGQLEQGPQALRSWLAAQPQSERDVLEGRVDERRQELPIPIGPFADSPIVRQRRAVDRLAAYLRELRGDREELVAAERIVWLRGGPHIAYLQVLVEAGRQTEATGLARTLLERAEGDDQTALSGFLADVSHAPDGWSEAVGAFATDPSPDGWDGLFRFTPDGVAPERKRYTLYLLLRLGVDPTTVFLYASRGGVTSEAALLAEQGLVEPVAIERRAEDVGAERLGFLGLAARAACVRGDRLGTVRLLRAAHGESPTVPPRTDLEFVFGHADPELVEMLERAGIRRPE